MTVPRRFQHAKLEDFPAEQIAPALEFVERIRQMKLAKRPVTTYGRDGGKNLGFAVHTDTQGVDGLVIVGSVGAGKTHLAAAISNAVPKQVDQWFVSALEVVDAERQRVGASQRGELHTANDLHDYPGLLFLDDLSAVRPTEFALGVLTRIIRCRYDEALCTVVTTHAGREDIAELFGAAIASRILEFGPLVELVGEDRRRPR